MPTVRPICASLTFFERIGEDRDRPTLVGVAEGRMRKRAAGEVIMVLGTGVPAGLQRPKAVGVA